MKKKTYWANGLNMIGAGLIVTAYFQIQWCSGIVTGILMMWFGSFLAKEE